MKIRVLSHPISLASCRFWFETTTVSLYEVVLTSYIQRQQQQRNILTPCQRASLLLLLHALTASLHPVAPSLSHQHPLVATPCCLRPLPSLTALPNHIHQTKKRFSRLFLLSSPSFPFPTMSSTYKKSASSTKAPARSAKIELTEEQKQEIKEVSNNTQQHISHTTQAQHPLLPPPHICPQPSTTQDCNTPTSHHSHPPHPTPNPHLTASLTHIAPHCLLLPPIPPYPI